MSKTHNTSGHDRHERISSMLQEAAAKFILQEANTDPLITVTHAHVSPDNKHATIFITTLPEEKEQDALIFLKRYAGEFRHFLKKESSMKFIPHIEFVLDAGERHRQHIDDIARDVRQEKTG